MLLKKFVLSLIAATIFLVQMITIHARPDRTVSPKKTALPHDHVLKPADDEPIHLERPSHSNTSERPKSPNRTLNTGHPKSLGRLTIPVRSPSPTRVINVELPSSPRHIKPLELPPSPRFAPVEFPPSPRYKEPLKLPLSPRYEQPLELPPSPRSESAASPSSPTHPNTLHRYRDPMNAKTLQFHPRSSFPATQELIPSLDSEIPPGCIPLPSIDGSKRRPGSNYPFPRHN